MVAGVDGILLCRQAKGIVAHGVQHVVALHPLHPGYDVRSCVALGMARVQTHPGGVREHVQHIVFGLGEVPYIRVEGVMLRPVFLPLFFNVREIVIHGNAPLPKIELLLDQNISEIHLLGIRPQAL